MTNGIVFAAREYKLLLDPAKLPAGPLHKAARTLWRERITPLIGAARGEFETAKQRRIVFRDTADRLLDRHGLALRERRKASDKGDLTLKLRVADLMIAAARDIAAHGTPSKLEEDIAPLANMVRAADGKTGAVLAVPPSIRSRFARSAEIELAADADAPADLAGVVELFDGLAAVIGPPGIRPLVAGPRILEVASKGQGAILAGGATAEFTMSVWYPDVDTVPPLCAELSFKVDLGEAAMSLADAEGAYALFTALQGTLGDMLELRFLSKTTLALPTPTVPA